MKKGNLKIRMKERGTMRAYLISKHEMHQDYLNANDEQLLFFMNYSYGPRHFKLWRYKH